jgi:hypothetical protein
MTQPNGYLIRQTIKGVRQTTQNKKQTDSLEVLRERGESRERRREEGRDSFAK